MASQNQDEPSIGSDVFKALGDPIRLEIVRQIAAAVPQDRLLVETDAPYLAPVPHRGKTNEPAYVAHTARLLGEVIGVTEAEIAEITTANFYRLFAKAAQVDRRAAA